MAIQNCSFYCFNIFFSYNKTFACHLFKLSDTLLFQRLLTFLCFEQRSP